MQYLIPLAALLSTISAAPLEVSPREASDDLITRNGYNTCPGYLTDGQYEFPHYISQVSQKYPDKAYGAQYNGVFTPNDVATVFNFDIPYSRKDATCSLVFYFPVQSQLQTSSYTYSGKGTFYFKGYKPGSCPNAQTTYKNQPYAGPNFPGFKVEPGHAYTIDVGPCSKFAGTCFGGIMWSPDTSFNYFQDYNPCPIGLYVKYSYDKKYSGGGWSSWP